LHLLALVTDGLFGDDGEFGGEEGRDTAAYIIPLQRAKSMALTQHFATSLRILEPRRDTMEMGEKHAGARSMLGSEDHARDLSPGVIFKAYSSGLYWL